MRKLDAGDLGDGVPLVGGFERPGQQGTFGDGLGREPWIDATRTEKEQPVHIAGVRGGEDIGFDLKVLDEKIHRMGIVVENAADPCGSKDDGIGPGLGDEGFHLGLPRQIERFASGCDHFAGFAGQAPDEGASDHPSVAGDPDPLVLEPPSHCAKLRG